MWGRNNVLAQGPWNYNFLSDVLGFISKPHNQSGKTYIQFSSCSFSLTCSEASGVNASEKRALLLQKPNACLHIHADRNCRRIQNCIFINLQWFMCSLSIFVCINLRKNCKLAVFVIEIDATTCQRLSYCSETLRWCILVFNMTTMSGII